MAENVAPFVCGGLSAMLGSSIIHPIDLSKVRLQLFATLNPGKPIPGAIELLSGMVKKDGVTSIYAGLSASLMRQAVYGTARIGLHRHFSERLIERNNGEPLNFGMKVLSGMASGSIAVRYVINISSLELDEMELLFEIVKVCLGTPSLTLNITS